MSLDTVTIPDTFSGPMGLLYSLIRRDEIDIFDIPIAKLATAYLEELRRMEPLDVDSAAEFLDMASRLLEIKSRMVMPPETSEDGEENEEEDDFDPRSGLVAALLEYRRFKDAAKFLGDMAEEQANRFPRVAPRPDFSGVQAAPGTGADGSDLMLALQNIFLRLAANEDRNVISYTEIPTAVRVEQIMTVLNDAGHTRFSLLLSGAPDRQEMVGFFIAMLELIRQGKLIARQTDNFSDIILEARRAPVAAAEESGHRRSAAAPRCFMRPPPHPAGEKTRGAAGEPPPPFPASAPFRPVRVARRFVPTFGLCVCRQIAMPRHGGNTSSFRPGRSF